MVTHGIDHEIMDRVLLEEDVLRGFLTGESASVEDEDTRTLVWGRGVAGAEVAPSDSDAVCTLDNEPAPIHVVHENVLGVAPNLDDVTVGETSEHDVRRGVGGEAAATGAEPKRTAHRDVSARDGLEHNGPRAAVQRRVLNNRLRRVSTCGKPKHLPARCSLICGVPRLPGLDYNARGRRSRCMREGLRNAPRMSTKRHRDQQRGDGQTCDARRPPEAWYCCQG